MIAQWNQAKSTPFDPIGASYATQQRLPIIAINLFIYGIENTIMRGFAMKLNILIYIIVLFMGSAVGFVLGIPGVIGMIAGAIAATLIFYDLNSRARSQTDDEIKKNF